MLPFLPPPGSTLFPYTTLFRSRAFALVPVDEREHAASRSAGNDAEQTADGRIAEVHREIGDDEEVIRFGRSEEHTSELQSRRDLVCRLLLENKNIPSNAVSTEK